MKKHRGNSNGYFLMTEAILKSHILSDFKYMKSWKRQNQRVKKKKKKEINAHQGLGGKEKNKGNRIFYGCVNTPYGTIIMNRRHYIFIQTHTMYCTRNET